MPKGIYIRTNYHKERISNGMVGHFVSDDTKKKIGNSNKGKHIGFVPSKVFGKGHIPWNKDLRGMYPVEYSEKVSGERNYNWKGGVTSLYKKIRKSVKYKLWREGIFLRDNYTCVICYKRGGIIHADHIKPFSLFPDLRFEESNGRTLCIDCHKNTDTYGNRISNYSKQFI